VLSCHFELSGYPTKSIPGVQEYKEHLPEVHTAKGYDKGELKPMMKCKQIMDNQLLTIIIES
jgi:hypothetical protein